MCFIDSFLINLNGGQRQTGVFVMLLIGNVCMLSRVFVFFVPKLIPMRVKQRNTYRERERETTIERTAQNGRPFFASLPTHSEKLHKTGVGCKNLSALSLSEKNLRKRLFYDMLALGSVQRCQQLNEAARWQSGFYLFLYWVIKG